MCFADLITVKDSGDNAHPSQIVISHFEHSKSVDFSTVVSSFTCRTSTIGCFDFVFGLRQHPLSVE